MKLKVKKNKLFISNINNLWNLKEIILSNIIDKQKSWNHKIVIKFIKKTIRYSIFNVRVYFNLYGAEYAYSEFIIYISNKTLSLNNYNLAFDLILSKKKNNNIWLINNLEFAKNLNLDKYLDREEV